MRDAQLKHQRKNIHLVEWEWGWHDVKDVPFAIPIEAYCDLNKLWVLEKSQFAHTQ